MRKKIGMLALMLTILVSSSAFCDYFEKLYVDLDQVLLSPSGIQIQQDDKCYEVDALIFDKVEKRYYVVKK